MTISNNKLLVGAAGGGGDTLNVEQVFSTDLWEGTGSPPAINNGIALADSANGDTGSSTEFDGNTDALNKSSDLTNNADGKTFTVSFWINPTDDTNTGKRIYHTSGSWRNEIRYDTNGTVFVAFFQDESSGGTVFELQSPGIRLGFGGWNHVIFSADMTDTSKRHLYINDQASSASYTHNNNNIDFTRSQHAIGDDLTASTGNLQGYLAHFFLDYTYRDLSVESNRRTFIDSARGSTSVSTLSALNPILYLPMTSGYSVGENEGTGGDFSGVGSPTIVTNNGTEAESGVGEGGMVWYRRRDGAENNSIEDTVRGLDKVIYTDSSNVEADPGAYGLQAFNSNGFFAGINTSGGDYVSWTFRKAEKFFDIVTYTGTGSNRTVNHNLGSVPGMIFIKDRDRAEHWAVYHRSLGNTKYLKLSTTDAPTTDSGFWQDTDPTSTQFSLGNNGAINEEDSKYVAYLFAHNNDDGGFGPNGDQDIIKCGKYTGDGGASTTFIDLGFEPQLLFIRSISSADNWYLVDSMRGLGSHDNISNDFNVYPNETNAESAIGLVDLTATGFKTTLYTNANVNSREYIYMAIRRGPMAVPENVSDVFNIDTQSAAGPAYTSGFVTDAMLRLYTDGGSSSYPAMFSRLTHNRQLVTSSSAAATTQTNMTFDFMNGVGNSSLGGTTTAAVGLMWKRAPGFFDVVAYKGTGSARTIAHNLGVAPEMMWVKNRDNADDWAVYYGDNTDYLNLNDAGPTADSASRWNDTSPTSSVFTVGTDHSVNASGERYINYLFATLAGISKVGSYTGNGNSSGPTVDCGFSGGPKFVLIKRATGGSNDSWIVFDTKRGLSAGNDYYLALDNTDGQFSNVDWIDPSNAGFQVVQTNTGVNADGDTYIFYAIAA